MPSERCFIGFDAYRKVIASGVDVVILTEPPHFRPDHLKAAIEAGKHVFCEKPVAVDAPGVRSVLATCEKAKEKNLSIVSGLCWRYHPGVRETMKRVLDGAIGEILAIQETYLAGTLWERPRQKEWTEMEFQMRNWYYFTWLSGDHNVEQHVHSLDKALWAMHDEPPLCTWGLGGRQVRTEAKFGDIYDHHAVAYEYPKGVTVYAYTRQQAGCPIDVSDIFHGTKGRREHPKIPDGRPARQPCLALQRERGQHVRHRAPSALCLDPQRKADQQRTLHGPDHDAGNSWQDGQLYGTAADVGPGDQLETDTGRQMLCLGRGTAHQARQSGAVPRRHARPNCVRLIDGCQLHACAFQPMCQELRDLGGQAIAQERIIFA